MGLKGLHFGIIFRILDLFLGFFLHIGLLLVNNLLDRFFGFLLGLVDESTQLGISRYGRAHCRHRNGSPRYGFE